MTDPRLTMPRPTSDPGRKLLAFQYMSRLINRKKASEQSRARQLDFAARYFGVEAARHAGADTEAVVTKADVTKSKGGRPPLHDRPMTVVERMRRYRQGLRAKAAAIDDA